MSHEVALVVPLTATVAPMRGSPAESVTVPVMVAAAASVAAWACAFWGTPTNTSAVANIPHASMPRIEILRNLFRINETCLDLDIKIKKIEMLSG